jgi:hypothetical protein
MSPLARPDAAREQERCDEMFQAMITMPDLRSVDTAGDREGLRRDVRRIASTLFCSADIDPSILTFAKHRAALHWDLKEQDIDAMVTARLLQKAAGLIRDLRWLGAEQPPGVLG